MDLAGSGTFLNSVVPDFRFELLTLNQSLAVYTVPIRAVFTMFQCCFHLQGHSLSQQSTSDHSSIPSVGCFSRTSQVSYLEAAEFLRSQEVTGHAATRQGHVLRAFQWVGGRAGKDPQKPCQAI